MERVHLPGTVGFFKKKRTDRSNNNSTMNSVNSSSREEEGEQGEMMECSKEGFVGEVKDSHEDEDLRSLSEKNHKEADDGGGDGVANGDSDDEDGWITPDNLTQACEEMGGVLEEAAKGLAVACVTTDFAMQVCECMH